jgi:hypothetical protein
MFGGVDADGAGGLGAQVAERGKFRFDLLKARAASVSATLRVVRASRRRPSRSSSARTEWLSADCETPSCAAARVKERSRATVAKAVSPSKLSRAIHEPRS